RPSCRSPNPASETWVTESSPPDFSWTADRAKTKVGLVPPKNGTIFRIVDFVPTTQKIESMDINTMMKVVGDHAPAKGLPPRHPMMHRTRSVDYAIILAGEIDMLLDDTEVHLKAGDVVVQQALRFLVTHPANQVIDELGERLRIGIRPFQRTKRQALIHSLLADRRVQAAAEQYAREKDVSLAAALRRVERYAREIVPAF